MVDGAFTLEATCETTGRNSKPAVDFRDAI
jgi:hypothetical protein